MNVTCTNISVCPRCGTTDLHAQVDPFTSVHLNDENERITIRRQMEDGTSELVLDKIIEHVTMKINAMNPDVISCTHCDFLCGPYELEPIRGVDFILDFYSRYPYSSNKANRNRIHPEFVLVFSDFHSTYTHISALEYDSPDFKKLIIIPTDDSKFPLYAIRVQKWTEINSGDHQCDTCTIRMPLDTVTQFPELLAKDGFVPTKDTIYQSLQTKAFSRENSTDRNLVLTIVLDELSELSNSEITEYINDVLGASSRESWNGKTLNTILMEYTKK